VPALNVDEFFKLNYLPPFHPNFSQQQLKDNGGIEK
jgi:hypothetical protein